MPDRVSNVKRLVSQLDHPVVQVVIEARIVIATESFARELGAKFGINGATGKAGDRSSVGFGGTTDASGTSAEERGNNVGPGNPRGYGTYGHDLNVNLPAKIGRASCRERVCT